MGMRTGVDTSVPDLREVGEDLRRSMAALVTAVPGWPHKPTPLARRLGLSRVTVSRILRAIELDSPYELLEAIPGPESLRGATAGASSQGVDQGVVREAEEAIDRFAALIREHFGTRAALSAAIRPRTRTLRAKVDHAGRAEVFKGMRQILGVEARVWLTAMFFAPSREDAQFVSVTTLHGALGVRRLRPDTQVYFTFGPPPSHTEHEHAVSGGEVSLEDLYTNDAARLETEEWGGRLMYRLAEDRLGKDAVVDMMSVSRDAKGSRRYAVPGSALRGVSLFVDVPVRAMVCDAIVHKDLFGGAPPEMMVFNPGSRGPANPNDPSRAVDRVEMASPVERVAAGPERFEVAEIPNYAAMIERIAPTLGHPMASFRVCRVRVAYPVTAFQYVLAFRAPEAPGA